MFSGCLVNLKNIRELDMGQEELLLPLLLNACFSGVLGQFLWFSSSPFKEENL